MVSYRSEMEPPLILQSVNSSAMVIQNVSLEVIANYDIFQTYWIGTVILLGLFGNTFSIMVFLFTQVRRSPTTIYLSALAISDTTFLLALMIVWLERIGVSDFYVKHDVICQSVIYTINICACVSTWLVVLFTSERFLVVLFPFHRLSHSTRGRAVRLVMYILPFPLLWYSGTFVVTGLSTEVHFTPENVPFNRSFCVIIAKQQVPTTIFHFLDIIVILIVPLGIIIGLNVRIGQAMVTRYKKKSSLDARRQLMRSKPHGEDTSQSFRFKDAANMSKRLTRSASPHHRRSDTFKKHMREVKTTHMLIAVSTVFVVLNLPHNMITLAEMIRKSLYMESHRNSDLEYVGIRLATAFYYMNFAINFILYNTASSNFRQCAQSLLRRIVSCGRVRWSTNPEASAGHTLTYNESNSLQIGTLQGTYSREYIKRGSRGSTPSDCFKRGSTPSLMEGNLV